MIDLTIPPDLVDMMQEATGQAILEGAQAFAVGGDTWAVSRRGGSGTTGPTSSSAPPPNVTLYIVYEQLDTLQPSVSGALVPVGVWRGYGPVGQDLRTGDVLTNTTDARWKFQVLDLDTTEDAIVATMEPKR